LCPLKIRDEKGLVPVLHENRFRHPLGVAEKLVPILGGGPLAGCCHMAMG